MPAGDDRWQKVAINKHLYLAKIPNIFFYHDSRPELRITKERAGEPMRLWEKALRYTQYGRLPHLARINPLGVSLYPELKEWLLIFD